MIYKIVYKTLGVKNTSLFSQFNLDYEIKDICFANGLGFFFTANQCVGHIDLLGKLVFPFAGQENVSAIENGYLSRVIFSDPCGICYNDHSNTIMIVECGGKRIRSLNINDAYYSSAPFANNFDNKLNGLLQDKYNGGKTFITSCESYVVWGNCSANYVFSVWNIDSMSVYGDGKTGFTYSNIQDKNRMKNPSGACFMKGALYISDKNNHCIRFFSTNDDSYGIIGKPLSNSVFPEKIICVSDKLYFIDNNVLKSVLKNEMVIVQDEMVISICKGEKDRIAILIGE